MYPIRPSLLPLAAMLSLTGTALLAQPVGPGWDGSGWDGPGWSGRAAPRSAPSPEGKVQVSTFVAEGPQAAALGQGKVAVTEAPAGGGMTSPRELATFEAAVIDALARTGYDTAAPDPAGGQVAEVRVLRSEAVPEEAPRKPVSGEMMMGVSNHGSMMGMALNVDLTKPQKALIATRLEARIKDRPSGAVLWEGHARILTRAGDQHWNDSRIAARLADALFDRFPAAGEGRSVPR